MPANDDFSQFWSEPSNVPCNGCKRCCQGEQVIIRPQDGARQLEFEKREKNCA